MGKGRRPACRPRLYSPHHQKTDHMIREVVYTLEYHCGPDPSKACSRISSKLESMLRRLPANEEHARKYVNIVADYLRCRDSTRSRREAMDVDPMLADHIGKIHETYIPLYVQLQRHV